MFVELNFKSGKPAYRQIVEQIKRAGAVGELRRGDPLPSIRVLAERLRINRNTVAKAYGELEHEGVVETVRGKGVFFAGDATPFGKDARRAILSEAIDAALIEAYHLQVGRGELMKLIEKRIEALEKRRQEAGS
jgi:GntR family transcriptional regulator